MDFSCNKMESTGLDFTNLLPIEVVEEIFKNLSSKDLLSCSLVCLKWREVVNNNRIWSKICQRDGIYDKEPLRIEESLFPNPTKKFRCVQNANDKFSDICQWRSHYDRYKFLSRNWKKGHCALHQLDVTSHVYPSYFNDGIMVILLGDVLEIYSIRGKIEEFCHVKLKYPDWPVHTMLVSNELLIYSQKRKIFGLRRGENQFYESFQIDVKCNSNEINEQMNSNQNELLIKRTENYIIVSDVSRPSILFIWNTNSGKLEKEVEWEKSRRNQLKCYCLEVVSLKVYIAFSINRCHYISEYDIVKNEWGVKFSVPFRVKELYVTHEILCAKVATRPIDNFDLYIWSLQDMAEVANIPLSENKPIVLTNDVVLYCTNNTINVHSLQTTFQSNFRVPADLIVNMFAIGNHLLVINTGVAIEIWDWGTGEKLYTPYRGVCSSNMWVSERSIIISRWSCNYQIIAYW